jgi:hypothetical protein
MVYPAHGAGSLCGKGMSDANGSTRWVKNNHNWTFRNKVRKLMDTLLDGQPFIPSYFG